MVFNYVARIGQDSCPGRIQVFEDKQMTSRAKRMVQILKDNSPAQLIAWHNQYMENRYSQAIQELAKTFRIDSTDLHHVLYSLRYGVDYIPTIIDVLEYPNAKLFVPILRPMRCIDRYDIIMFENFQEPPYFTDCLKGEFDVLTDRALKKMLRTCINSRQQRVRVAVTHVRITY